MRAIPHSTPPGMRDCPPWQQAPAATWPAKITSSGSHASLHGVIANPLSIDVAAVSRNQGTGLKRVWCASSQYQLVIALPAACASCGRLGNGVDCTSIVRGFNSERCDTPLPGFGRRLGADSGKGPEVIGGSISSSLQLPTASFKVCRWPVRGTAPCWRFRGGVPATQKPQQEQQQSAAAA